MGNEHKRRCANGAEQDVHTRWRQLIVMGRGETAGVKAATNRRERREDRAGVAREVQQALEEQHDDAATDDQAVSEQIADEDPTPAWAWDLVRASRRFRPTGIERFDTEANMGYVQIRSNAATYAHTTESRHVAMDWDTRGRLIGYELLREPREMT